MSKSKPFSNSFNVSDFVRHITLSWLLAVVIEYSILPNELRDLAKLAGLAQMSFIRVIGITCVLTILLVRISCIAKIATAERLSIVTTFAVLVITALLSNSTWAYVAVCILVLVILVVFDV